MLRKIILTGATGFVGTHCLESWNTGQDLEVLPVVRSGPPGPLGAMSRCLRFDEFTADKLRDLGWGGAGLVHLTGASRDYGERSMWESIVGTTEVVTAAAQRVDVHRIVYLSGFGVDAEATEPYFAAKYRAEEVIRASGVPYTIFRASYILGRGDELVPGLVAALRQGRVDVPGSGRYRMQPLHVADVVELLKVAVSEVSDESQTLPLLGEPIAYVDFVRALARKVAPRARVATVELEDFIRRMLRSPDPELSMSELCVLICDRVGPPTRRCLGRTLPGLGSVMERIDDLYGASRSTDDERFSGCRSGIR